MNHRACLDSFTGLVGSMDQLVVDLRANGCASLADRIIGLMDRLGNALRENMLLHKRAESSDLRVAQLLSELRRVQDELTGLLEGDAS